MSRTVSATEARVHFGELMSEVIEHQYPIVVEKNGKPQVVVLAVDAYERLRQRENATHSMMEEIQRSRALVAQGRQGRPLPPAAEIIRQMREERDEHILNLPGR